MEWKDLLPLLLVILGWFTVHRLEMKRDRCSSIRLFCAETRKLVEQIERNSTQYHTGKSRDFAMESVLKADLNKLDARLQQLGETVVSTRHGIFFRQAVTAKNFETTAFFEHSCTDMLVQDIWFRSAIICEQLYKRELS
jgi:hypothetical protein